MFYIKRIYINSENVPPKKSEKRKETTNMAEYILECEQKFAIYDEMPMYKENKVD